MYRGYSYYNYCNVKFNICKVNTTCANTIIHNYSNKTDFIQNHRVDRLY